MFFQVTADFTLEPFLEHGQQEPEFGHDVDLFPIDLDAAVNAGAFKVNGVSIPAVVNIKFLSQVLGQLVSSILGRSAYSTEQEREAEMLASMIRTTTIPSHHHDPEAGRMFGNATLGTAVNRIADALGATRR